MLVAGVPNGGFAFSIINIKEQTTGPLHSDEWLAYYSPNILQQYVPLIGPMAAYVGTHYHWITVYTNVFALVAHIGESLYALYLCMKLKFSKLASFVVQTSF
ncbi:hypothetical protein COOONC_21516 [Cooperia oncophora]